MEGAICLRLDIRDISNIASLTQRVGLAVQEFDEIDAERWNAASKGNHYSVQSPA